MSWPKKVCVADLDVSKRLEVSMDYRFVHPRVVWPNDMSIGCWFAMRKGSLFHNRAKAWIKRLVRNGMAFTTSLDESENMMVIQRIK